VYGPREGDKLLCSKRPIVQAEYRQRQVYYVVTVGNGLQDLRKGWDGQETVLKHAILPRHEHSLRLASNLCSLGITQ
jgi:hypothetical protein